MTVKFTFAELILSRMQPIINMHRVLASGRPPDAINRAAALTHKYRKRDCPKLYRCVSFHRMFLKNAIRNGTQTVPYNYRLIFISGAISFILRQPLFCSVSPIGISGFLAAGCSFALKAAVFYCSFLSDSSTETFLMLRPSSLPTYMAIRPMTMATEPTMITQG